MSRGIVVTLPSNVNNKDFPDNTNSSYTVRLSRQLDFDPGTHECALSAINYRNNWKNVVEGIVTVHQALLNGGKRKIHIPLGSGRYTNIPGMIDRIHEILDGFNLRQILEISFNSLVNQTKLFVRQKGYSIQFSRDLAEILGYTPNKVNEIGMHESESPPDIDRGFTSIFVYTSLIRDQLVGDVSVLLLRVVSVQGEAFTNQSVEFKNPQYLDMNDIKTDLVQIVLSRDDGTPVPFDGGKVILTVHIRPKGGM